MDGIGIIGAGNMGEALIKGFLRSGLKRKELNFFEISRSRREFIRKKYRVKDMDRMEELMDSSKYIVIATKPQDGRSVLERISPNLKESHVLISVMAGVSLSRISSFLRREAKIVRVMPNICVSLGQGVMGITKNDLLESWEYESVLKLFSRLGYVVEIKEELFDAMTAYAGSGPAFFLSFLEGMIDAGVKMGFSRDLAYVMALYVVRGSVSLLFEEKDHPTILKERITSPSGTTIYGLSLLERRGFRGAIIEAFEVARNRSRELSA